MERSPRPASNPPRTVAVFRALQLGDMLCAVPALRALRTALPGARITLIGLPWAREFAARYSGSIEVFVAVAGYPGLPEQPPEIERIPAFLSLMQERQFDLVLQLHGSGRISNPLTLLFGGRTTAGFYRSDDVCPDDATFVLYPEDGPERLRLLRLMEFLGMPACGDGLEFPLHDSDRSALQAIERAHAIGARPYVCVHAGARHAARRWPAARFAAVADALASVGLAVVLTGSADERPITDAVQREMRARAIDLAGETTLGSLAALLAGSRLLICNDTGVSHLADALGVPSVIVFTGSEHESWAPGDGERHRVLRGIGVEADDVVRAAANLLDAEAVHAA
jgi:ADP-heptose:LPS heptosyltransferase